MQIRRTWLSVVAALVAVPALAAAAPSMGSSYHVVARWQLGGDGGWDYMSVDPATSQLYIMADAFAAPDEHFGAGDQLSQIKGFGQIVVGPVIEQSDDGVDFGYRRQNQHRSVISARANAAQDVHAAHAGEHQVQHDQVVGGAQPRPGPAC